jgi:Fe-S-cluster containining protein
MTHNAPQPAESVAVEVALSGPDWQLRTTMSVPTDAIRLRHLLPLVQSFTDAVVDAAVRVAEEQGNTVSCTKGCGACCRQLVPIAEVEARHIGDLVERLPEPRRMEIQARFAEARRRLEEAGLLEALLHREQWTDGQGRSVGLRYFQQGIPCPFLQEEACSIYADRPLACREYLVTSPAAHCAQPTADTVRCVQLPVAVWTAVARFDDVPASARCIRWVPLILAPEWAQAHPDALHPRPGPELLRTLFDHLTDRGRSLTQPAHLPLDQV